MKIISLCILASCLNCLLISASDSKERLPSVKGTESAYYYQVELAPLLGLAPPQLTEHSLIDFFPKPIEQGHDAICLAVSLSYIGHYFTFVERRSRGSDIEPLYSARSLYNHRVNPREDPNCQRGMSAYEALTIAKTKGLLAKTMWDSDDCQVAPSDTIIQTSARFVVDQFQRLEVKAGKKTVDQIRKSLLLGYPVLGVISVDKDFISLNDFDFYARRGGSVEGQHAISVIGFDDKKRVDSAADFKRGAFHAVNSWDTTWGKGGYVWIGYDAMTQILDEAYLIKGRREADKLSNQLSLHYATPESRPSGFAPSAYIREIGITNVQTSRGPGIGFRLVGFLNNAMSKKVRTAITLSWEAPEGLKPIYVNPRDIAYRGINGIISINSQEVSDIGARNVALEQMTLLRVPIEVLNFGPLEAGESRQLVAVASVFVDDLSVGTSAQIRFSLGADGRVSVPHSARAAASQ